MITNFLLNEKLKYSCVKHDLKPFLPLAPELKPLIYLKNIIINNQQIGDAIICPILVIQWYRLKARRREEI